LPRFLQWVERQVDQRWLTGLCCDQEDGLSDGLTNPGMGHIGQDAFQVRLLSWFHFTQKPRV
jgi:hypothetical protein